VGRICDAGGGVTASAKSLFRATKAKRTDDRDPLLVIDDSRKPDSPRRADDFYPTGQPEAIRALLACDGSRIRSAGHVWEPACGDGALVREIRAAGLPCIASDLIDRGCADSLVCDFFSTTYSPAPAIITNPPYNLINARDGKGAWLRHSLALPGWRYLALLLSWDWPAARQNGLGAMLDAAPFSWCYLMRWKLDFTGEGSPPQRNAWFVWDREDPRATDGTLPHPEFRWMDRADARQGVLL
jgi:hypothetical protein